MAPGSNSGRKAQGLKTQKCSNLRVQSVFFPLQEGYTIFEPYLLYVSSPQNSIFEPSLLCIKENYRSFEILIFSLYKLILYISRELATG